MLPIRAAVLCGLGSWVPPHAVTNAQLSSELDTSDEWIRRRTGIARRHVAAPGTPTSDLAVEAGQRALRSAEIDVVDALVLATTTPDHPCPATAPAVATRLRQGRITAFDVSAVCAGFIYALASAAGLIAAGIADTVLVIGADVFTSILDPRDRTTRAIFGDGAGAVVLRGGDPAEPGALGPFHLGSDGCGADLDRAGWPAAAVDWLVCHQANLRITNAVAARLGISPDRCLTNIEQVGNTAAASTPLALSYGAVTGALRPGDRLVLTAFGGGLTWGSTLLYWPEINCGD
jgi:3-oxoacyl-[acyl-carrier-protein] synthase-3